MESSCLYNFFFRGSDELSKFIASGIPIRQLFYNHTEKDASKHALGMEPSHKYMVMMCDSTGCGPIEKLAGVLTEQLQEGFDLTVICGTNDKLKVRLEQKYGSRKNLHICGFVKDMSVMLDSADLCLTKAGGISVTEAATKNLPMVYIKAVSGCEDYNGRFYTNIGGARIGTSIDDLTNICREFIFDTERCTQMKDSLAEPKKRNDSECIYTTLKESKTGVLGERIRERMERQLNGEYYE